MPHTNVAGEKIFYFHHQGAPEGQRTLVFIHGAGGSHLHWSPPQLRCLAGANTYALDLPGHGQSEGQGRTSVNAYADFVAAFLETLDLEQVTLVGHSMGGATALDFALRYPEKTAGLVLVGSGARLRVAPAILDGIHQDFDAAVRLICDYAFAPETSEQLKRASLRQMRQTDPDVLYGDFAACDAFDVMDRLGEIRCPTLAICGTADRLTPPKYSTYLRANIPGAQLILIEGAGHMVMLEQPEAVSQAIADFSSMSFATVHPSFHSVSAG
jgi:pimeloyl-ACP methyl ester carboxylesterase